MCTLYMCIYIYVYTWSSHMVLMVRNLLANAGNPGDMGSIADLGTSPEGGHAPLFMPGESPWTEKSDGLWSEGS